MGRLATARRIKTAGRPRQPFAQAEPPVLLSAPVRPGGAGAIRARAAWSAPRSEGSGGERVLSQEPWHRRVADQRERDGPGSGNLIVITGTNRTDGTVSRPGQALVQDPVQILVTGHVLVNSASSCAMSRTTAPPPGAAPRLMHSNATHRGRADILKRPNRLTARSGSVAVLHPRSERGRSTDG